MTSQNRSSPPASHLIYGGVLVTDFETPTIFLDGAVAWHGGRIVAVGEADRLLQEYEQAEQIDARGGLIVPGLINVHHHLYSALARGLAPQVAPVDFRQVLEALWWRLDRALTPEAVRISALLGAIDCIRWGSTTIFDHHASPACIPGILTTIAEAIESAGLSAVLCYEVSDRNGRSEGRAGVEENSEFCARRRQHPRVRGTMGLHASFTLTDETLDLVARGRHPKDGCHIHIAEDEIDRRASLHRFGSPPLDRLEQRNLLDSRTLLVHGIHLSPDEYRRIAAADATLIHCPESNSNNAVGRLDVENAASHGCRVALGTDGMSSAVLGSVRAAVLAQRDANDDPGAGFSVHPSLLAANARLARVFFDNPHFGRIEPDGPADLCVIDSPPPTPITPDNLFGHLVYGGALAPVRHTIAHGTPLMLDFEVLTIDPAAVAEEARRLAPAVWEKFAALEPTPIDLPGD